MNYKKEMRKLKWELFKCDVALAWTKFQVILSPILTVISTAKLVMGVLWRSGGNLRIAIELMDKENIVLRKKLMTKGNN